ncbi:MAG: UMP kinase [Chlamydiales bacterium]
MKGDQDHGVDGDACQQLAEALKRLHETGMQIGVVIGGGNIFRGINSQSLKIPRSPADMMGMLATMINGIALRESLESLGCPCHVMSGLDCPKAVEPYRWYQAVEYLKRRQIVIFVGGTGSPFFTTDTAAALRASEVEANLLLKATKVNGVFDKDPFKHPDATYYPELSYAEALNQNLRVMDATSIALCRDNHIPILIFNMQLLLKDKETRITMLANQGSVIY